MCFSPVILLPSIVLCINFCSIQAVSLVELNKLFNHNKCIEGSLLSLLGNKYEDSLSTKQIYQEDTSTASDKSVLSQIEELAAFNKLKHYYELVDEEGPDHQKKFTIKLTLGDETFHAVESSLKKAKHLVASNALEKTEYDFPVFKYKEKKEPTPALILNNFATKFGLKVEYYIVNNEIEALLNTEIPMDHQKRSYLQKLNESIYNNQSLHVKNVEDSPKGPFKIKVVINQEGFVGVANSIQQAKHNAADKALKYLAKLIEDGNLDCLDASSEKCKNAKENIKSSISKVYEAAHKRNLPLSFEIIKESGPAHKRIFVTECKLGEFTTVGEGSSKKKSKTIAAERMLENVQNLPEIDHKSIINTYSNNKKTKQKKKKIKVIKTNFDKMKMVLNDVLEYSNNLIHHFSGDNTEDQKEDFKPNSPTQDLLKFSNRFRVEVHFADFEDTDGKFASVLSLHLKPSYICLGESENKKDARNRASQAGINLMHKLGLLDMDFRVADEGVENEEEERKYLVHFIEEKDEL